MQKYYVYLFVIDEEKSIDFFFCPQKKVHFIAFGSILFKKKLLCVLQHIFFLLYLFMSDR